MRRVVIGLGANLSNRVNTIVRAIEMLTTHGGPLKGKIRCADPFQSRALLPPDHSKTWDTPYVNTAIAGDTDLSPLELLKSVKQIEVKLGRQPAARWAPRLIDIDILLMEGAPVAEPDIIIPHPGFLSRSFTIWPAAAVAPDWKISVNNDTPAQSLKEFCKFYRITPPGKFHHDCLPLPLQLFNTFRQQTSHLNIIHCPLPYIGPLITGILNISRDSFSEDGKDKTCEEFITNAHSMLEAGVGVIEIGGESFRPGAIPISVEEEHRRLEEIVPALVESLKCANMHPSLSIDTRNASTAKWAVELGITYINDVEGFANPEMRELASLSNIRPVLMHNNGIPPDPKQTLPQSCDVINEVMNWINEKASAIRRIDRWNIVIDPGIGFGKTISQNWEIIRNLSKFKSLGYPIMLGHSRKSFLKAITELPAQDRDLETSVITAMSSTSLPDYVRVHNVRDTLRALKTASALSDLF